MQKKCKVLTALLLVITLGFTSVCTTWAAETYDNESVTIGTTEEELGKEGMANSDEAEINNASRDNENNDSTQNLGKESDNSNEVPDNKNEIVTEENSDDVDAEEDEGVDDESIVEESSAESYTANETAEIEEPSEEETSIEAKTASVFAGGSGTESDPYKVSTAAQLNSVRNYPEAYFIQTTDINMSSISNWEPIGKDSDHCFWGGYDGKGHTISNLRIKNDGSESYIGLFGYAGPEIKNLNLENANIVIDLGLCDGSIDVGTLAGNAPVVNCSTSGTITVTGSDMYGCDLGGIAGKAQGIENSHSDVTITVNCNGSVDMNIGGLAGECLHGTAVNSYFKGAITTSGNCAYLGGIVGTIAWGSGVTNCVNYGDISVNNESAGSTVAGIVGTIYADDNTEFVENCVNFGNITGSDVAFVVGITRADGITVHNCFNLGNIKGNSYSGRIYTAEERNVNAYGNYGYENATVNGSIPTGGLLPSGFNGSDMSTENLRFVISDILEDCGCEWVEPQSMTIIATEFNLPNDIFSFENSIGDIGVGANKPYPINNNWYVYFEQHKFTVEEVKQILRDASSFGGVCAGLTSLVIQNHEGYVSPSSIQKGTKVLHDVDKPANNTKVQEYVGINQFCLTGPSYAFKQQGFMHSYSGKSALEYIYNLSKKIENSNKLIYVDYVYCEDYSKYSKNPDDGCAAHAILVYGMETNNNGFVIDGKLYKYRLLTIDPNYAYDGNSSNDSYIYISEDFNNCIISKSGTMTDNAENKTLHYCGSNFDIKSDNDFFFQFVTNDLEKVLPVSGDTPSTENPYFIFSGSLLESLYLFNNATPNISGILHRRLYVPGDLGSNKTKYLLEKGDCRIELLDDGDFSLYTGDSYIFFESEGSGGIAYSERNKCSVNSSSPFSFSITSDDLPVSNDDIATFTITGDKANDLELDLSGDNVIDINGEISSGMVISCESLSQEIVYSYTVEENASEISLSIDSGIQIEKVGNEVASGSCGNSATWTLSENGTLTISGSGDMYDYKRLSTSDYHTYSGSEDYAPWIKNADYRKRIKRIIVKEGIEYIGNGTFEFAGSEDQLKVAYLTEIKLPSTLKKIGASAFAAIGCRELTLGTNGTELELDTAGTFQFSKFDRVIINGKINKLGGFINSDIKELPV